MREGGNEGGGEGREDSPSAEAVARCCPVMSNAISRTSSSCPLSVVMTLPEAVSHSLQVWSMDAVAITEPVKLKIALEISPR